MQRARLVSMAGSALFWQAMLASASPGAAQAATMQAGVNLSGMEFGSNVPGTLGTDYTVPTAAEFAYYHGKGVNLVRLPVLWERIQPGLFASPPSAAFSQAYVKLIKTALRQAHRNRMSVVVDIHDYGGYGGHKLGDGTLTDAMYAAFWKRLATTLKSVPGLGGYDIMNEPNAMPSAAAWPEAAQEAVNAIRSTDTATRLYVEGDFYASAGAWTTYNQNLSIADSAGNLVYEAHVYGDRDSSGSHYDWNTEVSYGVSVDTIAQRVGNFTGWCAAKGVACMIGEVGVGNDDPSWNTELANGLAAMQSAGIQAFTYWAGGPWWGSYPMSIEPTNGVDAPQMAVVSQYGAP